VKRSPKKRKVEAEKRKDATKPMTPIKEMDHLIALKKGLKEAMGEYDKRYIQALSKEASGTQHSGDTELLRQKVLGTEETEILNNRFAELQIACESLGVQGRGVRMPAAEVETKGFHSTLDREVDDVLQELRDVIAGVKRPKAQAEQIHFQSMERPLSAKLPVDESLAAVDELLEGLDSMVQQLDEQDQQATRSRSAKARNISTNSKADKFFALAAELRGDKKEPEPTTGSSSSMMVENEALAVQFGKVAGSILMSR